MNKKYANYLKNPEGKVLFKDCNFFFFTNKHYFYSTVFVKSCEIVCVCREVRMKCLLLTFSTTESALEISSLA